MCCTSCPTAGMSARPPCCTASCGFLDAGAASRLAVESLLSSLKHHPVATFDVDELIDWRAVLGSRSSRITTARSHRALVLHGLRDESGPPFLLLTGPEPDRWERWPWRVGRSARGTADGRHVEHPDGGAATRPITLTTAVTDVAGDGGESVGRGDQGAGPHAVRLGSGSVRPAGTRWASLRTSPTHHHILTAGGAPLIQSVVGATNLALPTADLKRVADTADAEIATQVAESNNAEAIQALEKPVRTPTSAHAGGAGKPHRLVGVADRRRDRCSVEEFLAGFDQPEDDK